MLAARYDAVVVGSGPNGLVAALTLAKRGLSVLIIEAHSAPGGGCRSSADLTLPGFVHDTCSAIHPMALLSPAFRQINLQKLGVQFIRSPYAVAHPLPNDEVAILEPSIENTAARLGEDSMTWPRLMRPFANHEFFDSILGPAWSPAAMTNPIRQTRFGLHALRSSNHFVRAHFKTEKARALFGGCAAHSIVALDRAGTASFGLALALSAHVVGWPLVAGGSQKITDALLAELRRHDAQIQLNTKIASLSQLPPARAILFDLSPRQIANICGDALPTNFSDRYRQFQHGPGIFKIDYALSAPIPWKNPECAKAATVHISGTYEELARAEAQMFAGIVPEKPFVLLAQQSLFDSTRAPRGKQTAWAYCHIPNGCKTDMTQAIENQIERFAPGFRDTVLARHTTNPAQQETQNPTMLGGDIGGGLNTLGNTLFRPVLKWNPYTTPNEKIFICSSSTPPGGGVHGMSGLHAANAAIAKHFC